MKKQKFNRGDRVINTRDTEKIFYIVTENSTTESPYIPAVEEDDWEEFNKEYCFRKRKIKTHFLYPDSVEHSSRRHLPEHYNVGDKATLVKERIPESEWEQYGDFSTIYTITKIYDRRLFVHIENKERGLSFEVLPHYIEKQKDNSIIEEQNTVNPTSTKRKKPALGIIPRKFFIEDRQTNIEEAIQRHIDNKQNIPYEWLKEYFENETELNNN